MAERSGFVFGVVLAQRHDADEGDEEQEAGDFQGQEILRVEEAAKRLGGGNELGGIGGELRRSGAGLDGGDGTGPVEEPEYAGREEEESRETERGGLPRISARWVLGIEEHDDEQEEHHHGAGVDEDLQHAWALRGLTLRHKSLYN